MKAIWKYTIPINIFTAALTSVLEIPIGAKLLTVREQHGDIAMWFEVDKQARTEPRAFKIFPTGTELIADNLVHVGTVMVKEIDVIHIYEEKK